MPGQWLGQLLASVEGSGARTVTSTAVTRILARAVVRAIDGTVASTEPSSICGWASGWEMRQLLGHHSNVTPNWLQQSLAQSHLASQRLLATP